ncbi:MAG: twin-arginine translocation signal domain-containing protein [Rhodobacteraceae bacterium]|nr:twin-arginine translocation signal domain-containing protein [Paracoccaceae bacterium]
MSDKINRRGFIRGAAVAGAAAGALSAPSIARAGNHSSQASERLGWGYIL